MRGKTLFFHLGNLFIVLSFFGFVYTFYPIVQVYLFPLQDPCVSSQTSPYPLLKGEGKESNKPCNKEIKPGFSISIPKIRAYAPVVRDVDPWNELVYKEALKKGVAHAKGTVLPGEIGTMFLFAHSSGAPWEISHYNTVFLRLGDLEKEDKIMITYNNKQYTYAVTDMKEVWPNEVGYLTDTKKSQLILQTCTPIGTTLKRLLIFAKPQNRVKATESHRVREI